MADLEGYLELKEDISMLCTPKSFEKCKEYLYVLRFSRYLHGN